MTNKYFEIAKKTTIDYIEGRISASEFNETFQKLDEIEIYKDLEKNSYIGISNYISAVAELDDQTTLESQTIVNIIYLFYAYFTNNFGYIYGADFYSYLKFGLEKENNNPVKLSFKKASNDYLNKKISSDCLGFIAKEFLNNLKYFQKEIKKDKKLFDILEITSKLSFNKFLEDLTPEEEKIKQEINKKLGQYLV